MDRSAIDATRFTATSPHADSKPTLPRRQSSSSSSSYSPSPSTSLPSQTSSPRFQSPISTPRKNKFQSPTSPLPPPSSSSSNGPAGETPLQKVARLRAARAKARGEQITLWELIVIRGRVVADKLHRGTVTGLIGFTVISGAVTIFALGDMIVYNRRKRFSYYAEQASQRRAALEDAIDAEKASRPLSASQAALLNLERARLAAEDERAQRKWGFRKVGAWLVKGLKGEDEAWKDVREANKIVDLVRLETETGATGAVGSGSGSEAEADADVETEPEGNVDRERRVDDGMPSEHQQQQQQQRQGGSLDRMAARAAKLVRLKTGWGSGDAGK